MTLDLNAAGRDLLARVRAAGLDPARLDPWEAWKVFKAFAREPVAVDAEAVYVQVGMPDPTDDLLHVTFIRELDVIDAEGELEPVREIVCDLGYDPRPSLPAVALEWCSLDYESLDAFVAAVEAQPEFQAAMALEPVGSVVGQGEL